MATESAAEHLGQSQLAACDDGRKGPCERENSCASFSNGGEVMPGLVGSTIAEALPAALSGTGVPWPPRAQ